MLEKPRYFPVSPAPLKMTAGLSRLGSDFGQGARDARFFQQDGERAAYLAAKRSAPAERHVIAGTDREAVAGREAALGWMRATLARECPAALAEAERDGDARDPLEVLARAIQEDVAVLIAGDDDAGRVVALDVRFPSGWRPERLAGASFAEMHRPVPDFASTPAVARSMVRAMVERGPYVRFVWTLCSDDQLDHHPDVRPPHDWTRAEALRLRVERQVTVPLVQAGASVFLIRTYLYPVLELSAAQQQTILSALAAMPEPVRAYKGLPPAQAIEALLARSLGTPSPQIPY